MAAAADLGSSANAAIVQASIYFLQNDTRHQKEKPYAFRYELDTKDIPQSNMEMKRMEGILITDIRGAERDYSLDFNGFTVLRHQSALTHGDYYDPERVLVYFRELEELLKIYLNASKVEVFRHAVRKRHPDFPISTGKVYEYDQPTSVAHIDTTPQEMKSEIQRRHGSDASNLLKKRSQWINIWKPLKGPLTDWPLTFCDAATVNKDADLEAADLLYPNLATENFQIYHRPQHKWYYLSDQTPSELIVFKQADSLSGTTPGVPHCSFYNPHVSPGEDPRESIEARALAYYDE